MSRKLKVTLTLDAELVPRVDDAAWLARLSRSAWVEARLEDALTGRASHQAPQGSAPVPVAPAGVLSARPVSASAVPNTIFPEGDPLREWKPEPKKPARKGTCEHRIGPDAYCPRCDA